MPYLRKQEDRMDITPRPQPPELLSSYHRRQYERYATYWQEGMQEVDAASLQKHAKAYRYYLRGWLPRKSEAAIMDVGCGRGILLAFFKTCGYDNVQGIDISPEQVVLARRMAMEVHEGDAIGVLETFRDAFDVLTGLDIIEHFQKPDVIRFLEAAHNALKPGGRLILQTPNADSPWGAMYRHGDFTHEVGFNPNSLSRLLRLTSFTETEARETGPVPWGYSMASTARYVVWKFIRACLLLWNLVEMGTAGTAILTRVFLISARKR
jgi:2-polyprenyl-3-methyl-5-hydroxy-6-metoxy-1,4-benzoquinol methylase